jgi:NADPH-dependent 2,4-dienoyl-CoA reductase/sulfur reductase-like enzyme
MEAARVCAERGHSVILFEAGAKLGGQIRIAAQSRVRRDIIGIADWLASECEELGVDIHLNTYAEESDILAENPDTVIIATGGLPDTDYVEGGDLCLSVWDVLGGHPVDGTVLIYDDNGQHQAPSLACELAERDGIDIAFVTPDRAPAIEMGASNYPRYLEKFHRGGVRVTPDHRIARVVRDGNGLRATFTSDYGGPEVEMRADHIVVEHGTLPLTEVYDALTGRSANNGATDMAALVEGRPQPGTETGFALHRIGDAVASRNIHAAIYDARRLALGV